MRGKRIGKRGHVPPTPIGRLTQQDFVERVLPDLATCATKAFRRRNPRNWEELVQEAICLGWQKFLADKAKITLRNAVAKKKVTQPDCHRIVKWAILDVKNGGRFCYQAQRQWEESIATNCEELESL